MPYLLVEAIQSSGAWGAVRVVPDEKQAMDVLVFATILESHGESLKLQVVAEDATGREWLEKDYESKASRYSYQTTRTRFDPFQAVYNEIANDLLEVLKSQPPGQLSTIRLVNELRAVVVRAAAGRLPAELARLERGAERVQDGEEEVGVGGLQQRAERREHAEVDEPRDRLHRAAQEAVAQRVRGLLLDVELLVRHERDEVRDEARAADGVDLAL